MFIYKTKGNAIYIPDAKKALVCRNLCVYVDAEYCSQPYGVEGRVRESAFERMCMFGGVSVEDTQGRITLRGDKQAVLKALLDLRCLLGLYAPTYNSSLPRLEYEISSLEGALPSSEDVYKIWAQSVPRETKGLSEGTSLMIGSTFREHYAPNINNISRAGSHVIWGGDRVPMYTFLSCHGVSRDEVERILNLSSSELREIEDNSRQHLARKKFLKSLSFSADSEIMVCFPEGKHMGGDLPLPEGLSGVYVMGRTFYS